MERVTEIKEGGKRETKDSKIFPGYVLVRMEWMTTLGRAFVTRLASPVSWAATASPLRFPVTSTIR